MIELFAKLDSITGATLKFIAISCLGLLILILSANVFTRVFDLYSMSWFDEVVELLFAWLVFVGAAALWRDHDHFRVDWLDQKIEKSSLRPLFNGGLILISLVFLVIMTWYSFQLTSRSQALTPIIQMPVKVMYISIPIAGFIMCLYSLRDLWRCVFMHNPSLPKAPNEDL